MYTNLRLTSSSIRSISSSSMFVSKARAIPKTKMVQPAVDRFRWFLAAIPKQFLCHICLIWLRASHRQSMPGPWWFCSVVSVVLGRMMSGKIGLKIVSSVGQTTAVPNFWQRAACSRSCLQKKMRYVGRVRCRAILGKKFKLLEAWSLAG